MRTATGVEIPEWLAAPVARPATGRALAVALGIGLIGDLAFRSGVASVGGALLCVATCVAMLVSGRLRTRQAQALVALAPAFGLWVAVRTSVWLVPLDILAAFGLVLLGVSLSSGGSLHNLPFVQLASRMMHGLVHLLAAPAFVPTRSRVDEPRGLALVRGLLVSVPVIAVLGALLASADAVFRSFFAVDLDGADLALHVVLVSVTAWVALGLLRVASAESPVALPVPRVRLGRIELTIVLGSVTALFGMFAIAQLVALSGAGERILTTEGLTYAQYARSGFFQLLWVASLTIAGLLVARALVEPTDEGTQRRVVGLSEAIVALTLVIVAVAFRRLDLYQDAYGLTMLRLYCSVAAVWIGAVVVLLGAWLAGVGRPHAWLPAAAVSTGLAVLFTLNAVNPEAVVVRHNVGRNSSATEIDPAYLGDLSDDAVPALAELLPEAVECDEPSDTGPDGWAAWNLGDRRADDARGALCRG